MERYQKCIVAEVEHLRQIEHPLFWNFGNVVVLAPILLVEPEHLDDVKSLASSEYGLLLFGIFVGAEVDLRFHDVSNLLRLRKHEEIVLFLTLQHIYKFALLNRQSECVLLLLFYF